MGKPPWANGMGSPPCGTPNGLCIPIDPNEIILIFSVIFGVYLIYKSYICDDHSQ